MTARPLWQTVLVSWALASIVLVITNAVNLYVLRFPDPDDAMRLMEVRDWLAGQSWWDVTQHRLVAGAMHWTRLVDLPIAVVILATKPLLGAALAERAGLLVVPMATLLLVIALGAQLTRRMLDDEHGRLGTLLMPLSVPLLHQLRPLRIDHHGWQVVLALTALYLLVGRASFKSGVLMGLSLAALIMVSLEGLPVAVALVSIAALAWVFQPQRDAALLGLVWSFFLGTLLLQLATRGVHYAAPLCDAVTPNWIAVLGTAATGVTLALLTRGGPLVLRMGALGLAGAATIAVLLSLAPECVAGPFAQLDPLTRHLWYERVSEGRPLWEQLPSLAVMTIGLPLLGLIGSFLVFRRTVGEARTRWLLLIGAQLAATLLAALVMRAGATANAFALPGAAWVLGALLVRARAVPFVFKRIAATAGALLLVSPGLVAAMTLGLRETHAGETAHQRYKVAGRAACTSSVDARAVGRITPGLLFASIDIAPDIVAATHHRAVASGYHRNMAAMHDVMAAFTGTPEAARTLIHHYGANYVVVCPGLNEPELYRQQSPDGFWARLERGERFVWLQPVVVTGSPVLVWRVVG